MSILMKCKMCGGSLEIVPGQGICECEYCGSKQTLPKTDDDYKTNLFNRANSLRLRCEFDKAEQTYEKILEKDPSEAEAHWGIVLCRYGIEYVDDPLTGKKIPTCHRTMYDAVTADPDCVEAINAATPEQKALYESEARAIDEIQKNILSIVRNEKPFDVFICYKETDENGKRTVDSVIANDIYHQLTQEGFKVFYAAITLEDKLGRDYEPYIFSALNSSKVMLVLGTKPEYYTAVWVRNEWSRFMRIMKKDRSRLLIPCYRDMDAYDLPEEFAHLQAQDMSKIGFLQDLIRGVKKVVGTTVEKKQKSPAVTLQADSPNVQSLVKRALIYLEDGDFDNANNYSERILDLDPESGMAYLIKMLVDLGSKSIDSLAESGIEYDNNQNYLKAIRYKNDDICKMIDDLEEKRSEFIYKDACKKMTNSSSMEDCDDCINLFSKIPSYKDVQSLLEGCLAKKAQLRNEEAFNECVKLHSHIKENVPVASKVSIYKTVISKVEAIDGFEQASALLPKLQDELTDLIDSEISAVQSRLQNSNRFTIGEQISFISSSIKNLEAMNEFTDCSDLIKKCKDSLKVQQSVARKKRYLILAIASVVVMILFAVFAGPVIKDHKTYDTAISLYESGNYHDSFVKTFEADTSECKELRNRIIRNYPEEILEFYKPGDSISFGSTSFNERITWKVLCKTDDSILLLCDSSYIVSMQKDKLQEKINQTIFGYKIIFSRAGEEKHLMRDTSKGPNGLFVPFESDIEKYLPNKNDRVYKDDDAVIGWLVLTDEMNYKCVDDNGTIIECVENQTYSVRPALWLSIN